MDPSAIEKSYARWAPIYDRTFGSVTRIGRRRTVDYVNTFGREVLEVGVGTGLALPHYDPGIRVTGVDYSEEMLEKARRRVEEMGLRHVRALRQMDARALDFPDDSFDTVVAMHVVSVVPEPERVVAEMARVCRPGGKVVITNHFARDTGALAALEKLMAPFDRLIGWHSDFELDRALGDPRLEVRDMKPMPPFGMMTRLVLEKAAQPQKVAEPAL